MAKFVIECPSCGRYAEAKTGFFAKKKIDCACGYTIDVKADKLTSKVCAHRARVKTHSVPYVMKKSIQEIAWQLCWNLPALHAAASSPQTNMPQNTPALSVILS